MNNEIKINRAAQSITFVNNGVGFSQLGVAKEILDLIESLQQEIERLNNIRNTAIEAINVYQDEKTLSVGYQDLKRIRGILQGNEFDLQMFEEYLQELKRGDKE